MTGRPLPKFSDDDVVDFCVAEVVAEIASTEQAKARKEAEKRQKVESWKSGAKGMMG